MGDYRKTKSTWAKPSANKTQSTRKTTEDFHKLHQGKIVSPWDIQDEDVLEEFDRTLAAMEVHVDHPWYERSTELRAHEAEKQAAQNYKMKSLFDEDPAYIKKQEDLRKAAEGYKFQSMFEVPPLTEKQQKAIDEYQMNPPFRCSYNQVPEDKRTAKKLAPNKNPITRQPWTYGSVPADPVTHKIFERPKTALWTVPKSEEEDSQLPSSGDPILDSLRAQLKKHGAAGIAGLSRKFRIMDDNQNGTLDLAEFVKGMKECKVADLSDKALKHLFLFFDRDDSGFISYDEFLVGVRGVLNDRRRQLVHLAFRSLDRDGSGAVELSDIKGVYNAGSHPDVIMNKRTEAEVLTEFMQAFQVGSKEKDAIITKAEFEHYYANLSASIDRDDYFELMIRNAWHISGGEGWAANTTNRRVLVTHADGRQTVEEIKNDLGLRSNDQKGMVQRLKAQGLKMASINTNGQGDAANQYEDPDFVQYRQEIAAAQRELAAQEEARGGGGSARGSGVDERRGSGANNSSSSSAVRPGTAGGPKRLSDYAGSSAIQLPGSAYRDPVPAHRLQQRPLSSAGSQALKPTSLANYIESNNNSGYGSARSDTSYGSGRR